MSAQGEGAGGGRDTVVCVGKRMFGKVRHVDSEAAWCLVRKMLIKCAKAPWRVDECFDTLPVLRMEVEQLSFC